MAARRRIALMAIAMCICSLTATSQEVYRMEMGGSLGGCFYMGDANWTTPLKNTNISGGALARFILNQRMAVKVNLTAARISGDTAESANKFPDDERVSFGRALIDLGGQYEYNFLPYGNGEGYNGGRRFTPYIAAGLGLTYAAGPSAVVTANIPVGVGVKYKIGQRLNAGCELTMRFSMSDRLDVNSRSGLQLSDPYGIKSKGLKNKDSYALVQLYLTYDLFAKCRECN
jgi:hypothetical protein